MPTPAFAELVTIGRVVKPQGRKGELLTEPLSDRPGRFPSLRSAFLPAPDGRAREVAVTACWPHKGRWVLKLEGVDSIGEAELLRGAEVRIREQDLPPLPPGEYYHHQLRGLAAFDATGRPLGRVTGLVEAGEVVVLELKGPGGELLLPLAEPFVREVDLAGGRIVLSLPETI